MIKKPCEISTDVKMAVQLIVESPSTEQPQTSEKPWSLHMLGDIGMLDIRSADGGPVAFTGTAVRTREENEANGALIVSAANTFGDIPDIVSYAYHLGMRNVEELLKLVQKIALEAFKHWDNDEDMKVGKILQALAGILPGYRVDTDLLSSTIDTFHREYDDDGVAT
ncbi:MAG: hypothetical protein WC919_07995 [Candidatus Paceibacterota bacterium]|jgi:hypothetical protein